MDDNNIMTAVTEQLAVHDTSGYANATTHEHENLSQELQNTTPIIQMVHTIAWYDVPLYRVIPLSLILGGVVIFTVLGNIFVIGAVYYERSLRTITNMFVISLAVSDLLVGCLVLPFSASYEIFDLWMFGNHVCVMWCVVDVLCCTASILNLVAISIDRYIAISRPLHYPNVVTVKRACIMITVVWVSATCICVPPLLGWRSDQTDPNECQLTSAKGYVIYSASGSFFIPTVIMVSFYAQIYRVAIKQQKLMLKNTGSLGTFRDPNESPPNTIVCSDTKHTTDFQTSDKTTKHGNNRKNSKESLQKKHSTKFAKEKKAAKTLAIVMGCFILCWLPFFSLYTIQGVCDPCVINEEVFDVFFWLGYCNSALNPIIYTLTNRAFKRALWKISRRIKCVSMSLRSRRRSSFSRPARSSGTSLPPSATHQVRGMHPSDTVCQSLIDCGQPNPTECKNGGHSNDGNTIPNSSSTFTNC